MRKEGSATFVLLFLCAVAVRSSFIRPTCSDVSCANVWFKTYSSSLFVSLAERIDSTLLHYL